MKKLALAFVGVLALAACETGTSISGGGDGFNRVVDITNTSGVTMTHFYASNSGESSWGPEQLGASTVLQNGQFTSINFNDGTGACNFDFRAKFANGQTLIRYNINVCSVSSYDYF